MTASLTSAPPKRELRAQAAAWLAKLHGPERSSELEADFRSWLHAEPENARAFEHMTEIWDSMRSVNVAGIPRPQLAYAGERRTASPRRPSAGLIWPAALAASAVVAVVLIRQVTDNSYTTDVGEQRIVMLKDGTRLTLNSATRIDVRYSRAARVIELDRGEALFEVVKDPRRPFAVHAGAQTVTALGTSFTVRHDRGLTAVTLLDGRVSVDSGDRKTGQGPATILTPGQRLTFTAAAVARLDAPKPGSAEAWRRGEVILDDTALGEAVAEMNRYERRRLILDSTDFADLPVSGIYRIGDSVGFARAIASVYGLAVEVRDNEIHLKPR